MVLGVFVCIRVSHYGRYHPRTPRGADLAGGLPTRTTFGRLLLHLSVLSVDARFTGEVTAKVETGYFGAEQGGVGQ